MVGIFLMPVAGASIHNNKKDRTWRSFLLVVGVAGFEPAQA